MPGTTVIETTSETIAQLKRLGVLDDKGNVMEAVIRGQKKKFKSFPKLAFSGTADSQAASKAQEAVALLNKNHQINLQNMQMLSSITKVSQFTMVLSGLNLFATVVGFAIMNDKLNKVSGKIDEVINLQKDTFDIQTVYKINEVIADYSNMMDGRKTQTYYTEKEMMKLVGDEWNALEMLMKIFCKGVSNNSEEFLFSMLSLASMLSTSLRFYDEIYYFEHKDVIRGGSIWHNDHNKWMSSFDKMLSKEFIERMQDYGFFDLDLNTSENDYFYKGYIEQISSLKQDVEDNQLLITSINDPDLFREITSNLSNEARSEIEAALDAVGADKKLFEDSIAAAVA